MKFNADMLKRSWMEAKGLEGDELAAYAVVFSATRGPKLKTVTSQYVSDWLGCDELKARRTLNRLTERGLLNGLRVVEYSGKKFIYAAV